MPLPANALVSLLELKDYLRSPLDKNSSDTRLEALIGEACAILERRARRKIAYRGSVYTEYHTIAEPRRSSILTLHWPIIAVSSFSEDSSRTYGATTLLTEGTDYVLDKEHGIITRVSGSNETWFLQGIDTLKLVYSAGYTATPSGQAELSGIPSEWKNACLRIAARIWREEDRKTQGISSYSDQLGNVTRYKDAVIPEEVKLFLDDETRQTLPTGREG